MAITIMRRPWLRPCARYCAGPSSRANEYGTGIWRIGLASPRIQTPSPTSTNTITTTETPAPGGPLSGCPLCASGAGDDGVGMSSVDGGCALSRRLGRVADTAGLGADGDGCQRGQGGWVHAGDGVVVAVCHPGPVAGGVDHDTVWTAAGGDGPLLVMAVVSTTDRGARASPWCPGLQRRPVSRQE